MEVYLVSGILAVAMLLIGLYIGHKMSELKKSVQLKELENQLKTHQIQLENSKDQREETQKVNRQQLEKTEQDFQKRLETLHSDYRTLQYENEQLKISLTRRQTEHENLQMKFKNERSEIKNLQEKFHLEFDHLANRILEKKSEKFTALNKTNLENILSPLQDRIKGFKEQVEKSQHFSLKRHAALEKQLEQLHEQNQKISTEATNLTRALKGDTKMQGDWGEMILERVLEQSGLQKDREYFVQKSFYTEDNKRLRPDVIIALPDEKRMIVDAKVSLIAYEQYINASETEAKKSSLKKHLSSLRKHIQDLSQKNYTKIYTEESPDFVLLFVPIESAFALASEAYPNLYSDAFDQNIIIVTPTTLLAVLKTIDSMWQNEKQKANAVEIATQSGRLYDSFVNLITDFDRARKQLQTVQNTHDSVMKKLTGKGNLVTRVENLKKLGAKASKQIERDVLRE